MFHNNAGASPAWYLAEVRARRQGDAAWTAFPCARWLAVHEDDGSGAGGGRCMCLVGWLSSTALTC